MTAASITNIPTGPQPSAVAAQQHGPEAAAWSAIAGLAVATGKAVQGGKGGPVLVAVMAGVLAGATTSSLLWGWHMVSGDRALTRRLDDQDDRIDKIEQGQMRIDFNVRSIATKVGADVITE